MGWYLSISLLTFYLSPLSLSSRLPCSGFLREDGPPASPPPPLHPDTSPHSQVQERGCGAHGTPAYRTEGQQQAGKGSALRLCLEAMGAHGSADPRRGGCERVLPPPWRVPSQPQPASLLRCCLQQGGDGSLALCGWKLNGNQDLGWDFFLQELRGKWATSPACLWKAHLSEGYWLVGGRQRARGAQRRMGICYCLNAAKILIKCSWYSIVIFSLVIHTKFIIKR